MKILSKITFGAKGEQRQYSRFNYLIFEYDVEC